MKGALFWIIGLLLCEPAQSIEADLTLQQLNHKGWTVTDGAPGAIYAIAQTTDGTLWLGGPSGLSRFDGIRFVRYDGVSGRPFQSTDIKSLSASSDGGLWIGFVIGGIGLLRAGGTVFYREQDGLPRGAINNIVTAPNGTTYAATTQGLYWLHGNRWDRITIEATDPSARISAASIDRRGTLWAVTDAAVWALPLGATHFRAIAKRNNSRHLSANSLASEQNGALWVLNLNRMGALTRIGSLSDSPAGERELPFADSATNPGLLLDREGNLWLGGDAVRRFSAATLASPAAAASEPMETFTPADGLTGGSVNCFFEDREGNIWAGTYSGLDRFSRSNVVRVSYPNTFGAAVAGEAGAVWVSAVSTTDEDRFPLLEIRNGKVVDNSPAPHFTSTYRSPDGSIWFGGRNGIVRLQDGLAHTTALPDNEEVQAMAQDAAGAMWVSIVRKGNFRLADGHWSQGGNLPTLPQSTASVITADASGKVWFGYPGNRIARVEGSTVRLFGPSDGLDVGNVTAIAARRNAIWIGGDRGLARFEMSRFTSISTDTAKPFAGISGIVAADSGDLWLNGNSGITHIPRGELERAGRDSGYRVKTRTFDHLDGMQGYARQVRPSPSAFEATDGRLWFATQLGLVSIIPGQILRNPLPPPITIWSLNGESVQYPHKNQSRLPVHTANVRIEYTAASLTIPERVRFRYKLEGLDRDWQDVEGRREAIYTNLGPGQYVFRVIASNNDGLWNNTGAALQFAIAPAFYQTGWFYALCGLACFALLRVLYLTRIRQVSAQVRSRLEERVAERERIARDLHDTLLQSVQGLLLRLHAAVMHVPKQEPARAQMERALERADEVMAEGRDRVRYLRSSNNDADLPQTLAAFGDELASEHTAHFRSTTEGTPRELHPIMSEEALLIAREALTNSFRHANARHIEAEVSYGDAELYIRIRDDGGGIDVNVLNDGGRPGHWGLLGMRERAKKLHATLTIWSKPGAGTELELRIPARVAYLSPRKASFKLWRRKSPLDIEG